MSTLDDLAGRLTVTVPEAGRALGLSKDAAYAAAHRGELPVLRMGRRLLVPVPRLLALVGHTTPDTAKAEPASSAVATLSPVHGGSRARDHDQRTPDHRPAA